MKRVEEDKPSMGKTVVTMKYLREMDAAVSGHINQLTIKARREAKDLVTPFRKISNKINITLAITNALEQHPFKSELSDTPTAKARKTVEAEKMVYRDFLFVATMSIIEYYFSQILLQYRGYRTTKKIRKKGVRKVWFSDLIDWANQEGIIADYKLWDFVRSARNDIVHHNAIARETMKCPINDFPINMVKGNQLTGRLRSILSLTKHIEEAFYNVVSSLK